MDLGIAGRKAIVCASSRGLGRACARALAEAGCDVIINGRDGKALEQTAAELRQATGAKVTAVQADVATPEGQAALLSACPEPDILVNNNAGPPFRDFRQLTRAQMLDGVIANMVVAVELTQKVIDPMTARKFGRIVNITSGSVKMPLVRSRPVLRCARRPDRVHGRGGALGRRHPTSPSISCCPVPSTPIDCSRTSWRTPRIAASRSTRPRPSAWPRSRPSDSAPRTSSARPARSCARRQAGYITGQNLLIDGGAFPGRDVRAPNANKAGFRRPRRTPQASKTGPARSQGSGSPSCRSLSPCRLQLGARARCMR